MTDTTPPRQIVWGGPNGHQVILDKDGVTLRPGGLLEEAEINRLLAVIAEARGASAATTAPAENRRLVSPAKAAEYAGVSHWTIRRRISDGTLTAYRMGPRLIRVDLNQIDAWVKVIPTVGTIGTGGDAA